MLSTLAAALERKHVLRSCLLPVIIILYYFYYYYLVLLYYIIFCHKLEEHK